MTLAKGFAERVIEWQRRCGRRDLPWQGTRDPYRIWLSEIMLQQTQVSTVVPYYRRLLARFPDVQSLAGATLDEVLELWSGLGYYSRARNLHSAAGSVVREHCGRFPRTREALAMLPGIGRSTAAAIAVFSCGAREAILDGNVQRVLSRCFAVDDVPRSAMQKRLWALAESLLPSKAIEAYTQGVMDLGSGVCTRSKPNCAQCPLGMRCKARKLGMQSRFPAAAPRKALPHRHTIMLLALREGEVLLQRRALTGIWGGLWSLPEFASSGEALRVCETRLGLCLESHRELQALNHRFTHFLLTITPLLCRALAANRHSAEPGMAWFSVEQALQAPIPSPVRSLLSRARAMDKAGPVRVATSSQTH